MSPAARKSLDLTLAALPTAAFVAVNLKGGSILCSGGAAVLAAVGVIAVKLWQKRSIVTDIFGLLVAGLCAAVAASTGEARNFFLAPAVAPFAVVVLSVGTVMLRRPLVGLILNRVSGGPADCRADRPLARIYNTATWTVAATSVVNATLQAIFYMADAPVVLAAIHVATAPVFATLVAVTLFYVRRELGRRRHGGLAVNDVMA